MSTDVLILLIEKYFPKFLIIESESLMQSLIHNYGFNVFYIGNEYLNQDSNGIALPKKSPLLVPFNMV